ncbi:MAG TPA: hypothetical protein VF939_12240 [Puia sp.]
MSTTVHKKGDSAITIDHNMRDYNKTPFAIKKAESARALIEKVGLPKKGTGKKNK